MTPQSSSGTAARTDGTHSMSDIRELATEFGALMSFIRARWARNAQEVHPELRGSGLMVLQNISRRGPITSTAICQALDMDKSTVSRLVTTLRELDFISVAPSEHDKRVAILTVNAQGQAAIEEMRARSAEDYLKRIEHWDQSDVQQLTALLHRFNESPEA